MRLAGKQKLGYFSLPFVEAERIRRFLQFPLSGYAALDPCIGDGGALKVIAENPLAIRYGIELDAYRVEQAREVGHHVIPIIRKRVWFGFAGNLRTGLIGVLITDMPLEERHESFVGVV